MNATFDLWVCRCCTSAAMFLLTSIGIATARAAEQQRLAPPTKEAREAAQKIVQELLGAQIDGANRGPAEAKLSLAKTLMKQAAETTDNAAARFVMYQKARDLAAAAGDVTVAMSAIDKLAEQYVIDAASDRFTTISGLARNAHSAEAGQAALDAALAAIDEAILADDFDLAGKLVRLASSLATRLHNGPIVAQLRGRPAELEQLKKEFAKASEAQTKLKREPDDAAANLTVGFFQGPTKGDFQQALPFLEKSSDPVLRELAKKELATLTEASEQAKLADGWWDAAEHQREPAKSHIRAHSVKLYEKALPNLKGLAQAQAESRMKQFDAEHPTSVETTRRAMTRLLTEGDWHITWFKSATQYSGPVMSEYPSVKFNIDGTCKTNFASGKWRFSDANSIEVVYLDYAPTYLQRFHVVGSSLRCEHFNPHDTLQNLGIGTKNPRP